MALTRAEQDKLDRIAKERNERLSNPVKVTPVGGHCIVDGRKYTTLHDALNSNLWKK